MKKIITVLIITFFFSTIGIAQSLPYSDSLEHYLSTTTSIQKKIISLNQLGAYYESVSDYSKSFSSLSKALELNKNNAFPSELIKTLNYMGYIYWHKSEYDSSLYYHLQALKIANESNINDENLAFTYLMLGNDYYDKGDLSKTSSYYYNCLKLADNLNNISIKIQCHNRLSKLYFKMKDYKQAIEHVLKSLKLNNNEYDIRELGVSYNNLGNLSLAIEETDSALYYFNQTLINFKNCGDIIGQSIASINLGDTYLLLFENNKLTHLLDSSNYYYKKSIHLNSIVDNKFGIIYGLWGVADVAIKKQKFNVALNHYFQALKISKEIGAKSEEAALYYKLHLLHDRNNQTDSSLYYIKQHLELKNQLENSEQTKQLLRQESKYEAEKIIAKEKAESEKLRLIEQEKNKWKNIIILIIVIVSIVLSYVSYISIKRLKIIRSKNKLINKINEKINAQKKEIIDSINYAKRIQEAILPSEKLIHELLPNSFIFYKPKDIVAGDFYWLEQKENSVFFAAADCTGHGVPGAMVSVVCNNALNRVLNENEILSPSKILDKTSELVCNQFIKTELPIEKTMSQIRDGMDVSLCSLQLSENYAILQWSGANNPLWIIRPTFIEETFELIDFKPNKQPIGKFDNPKPFTNHTIELKKGDTIYVFTDGYADQFGGEKGKKLMYKPFKEFLLSIQEKSMFEQKLLLEKHFDNWKGKLEQVDDVCVIGVRI